MQSRHLTGGQGRVWERVPEEEGLDKSKTSFIRREAPHERSEGRKC